MNPQNEQVPERLVQLISGLGDRLHRDIETLSERIDGLDRANEKVSAQLEKLDTRVTQLDKRVTQVAEDLTQLVSNVSESLHREMHDGFAQIDAIETRVSRHGSMLQIGARWTTRMQGWSEKIDQALAKRDKRLSDLEERVKNLERKPNGHQ